MSPINVRNLEQIQEADSAARPSRLSALVLAALASAAIVTATVVMAKRKGPAAVSSADPLAALVSSARAHVPAESLERSEVTFPGVLSDGAKPTTALAAVKDARGRLIAQPAPDATSVPLAPPPAMDRLPLAPLPVGTLMGATSVTTEPKDPLTALAADASRVSEMADLAPAGMDGGYQLQVASFKDLPDADQLVADLRRRGHRAFRQAAYVPERGLWHRVRVGPFKSRLEAQKYKLEFERAERVSPFLVDPQKVKQADEIRAARVAAQDRRSGRLPTPD